MVGGLLQLVKCQDLNLTGLQIPGGQYVQCKAPCGACAPRLGSVSPESIYVFGFRVSWKCVGLKAPMHTMPASSST